MLKVIKSHKILMSVFIILVCILIVDLYMKYINNINAPSYGTAETHIKDNKLSLDDVKVGVKYKSESELDEASSRIASVAWNRVKEIYPNALYSTIYFLGKDNYGRYLIGFDILKNSYSEMTSGINVVVYVEDINDWSKIFYYKNVVNAYAGQLETNYNWGKPFHLDSSN